MIAHFSYDRVFQTPSFENILLSNSFEVQFINPDFLRLPVEPSQGNYYEAGVSKAFGNNLRLDVNYYLRNVNNYADDDQIENTTISFPIAFRKATIYGAEAKIEVPNWHGLSGFVSYSYMVGNVWFPVTGGLFLGDDVQDAQTQLGGHFPDSQDQRNTLFTRWMYQVKPRFWVAGGMQYGSGLPFEFDGDYETALEEYGPAGPESRQLRPRPNLSFVDRQRLGRRRPLQVRPHERSLQVDGQNLNNELNLIDFGGLFSGNAIGPSRSFALRLTTTF